MSYLAWPAGSTPDGIEHYRLRVQVSKVPTPALYIPKFVTLIYRNLAKLVPQGKVPLKMEPSSPHQPGGAQDWHTNLARPVRVITTSAPIFTLLSFFSKTFSYLYPGIDLLNLEF